MSTKQKVLIVGNVGNDPEVRRFEDGGVLVNFSVATNKRYKNRLGEKVEETEWHRIVMRDKKAELVEKYVTKGTKLWLEGELKTRGYEKGGETRYITEIHCFEMTFLGGDRKDTSATPQNPAVQGTVAQGDSEVDDLPFVVNLVLLFSSYMYFI